MMFKTVLLPIIAGYVPNAIRHGATALGTYLIAQGFADKGTSEQVTGALVVIGGFLWSVAEKKGLLAKLIG